MPSSFPSARTRIPRVRRYLPSLVSAIGMAALTYTIDTQFPLPVEAHFPTHTLPRRDTHLLQPGTLATIAITTVVVLLVARINRLRRTGMVLMALLAAALSLGASALAAG